MALRGASSATGSAGILRGRREIDRRGMTVCRQLADPPAEIPEGLHRRLCGVDRGRYRALTFAASRLAILSGVLAVGLAATWRRIAASIDSVFRVWVT